MSPLVQQIQLYLIVPKAIESLFFLINLILINKRYKGVPWKQRPLLHKLILFGLLNWFVYIFLDIFIYVFGAFSFDSYAPSGMILTYQGYTPVYPSLLIVNILRDIGYTGALVMVWAYFFAALSIRWGEHKTLQYLKNWKLNLIVIVSIGILVAMDTIQVIISETNVKVSAIFDGFAGASILTTIIAYFLSGILLNQTLKSVENPEQSHEFVSKVRFLRGGILIMGFGHLYWFFLGLSLILAPSLLISINPIIIYYFGHMLWAISPIFIYQGLKIETKPI